MGRHKRPDGRLQAVKERAERVARRLHPDADEIRANPAHSCGCIVEVHYPTDGWSVYRYTGENF